MHHSLKKIKMSYSNECYKIIIQCFAKLLLIIINPHTQFINSLPTKWKIMPGSSLKKFSLSFPPLICFLGFLKFLFTPCSDDT